MARKSSKRPAPRKRSSASSKAPLQPLFLENELHPSPPVGVILIDHEVLASYNACPRAANEQVTPARQRSRESVQNLIESNIEVLSIIDPSFKVV